MAISNFTQSVSKIGFLASLLPRFWLGDHEKKSCCLADFSPFQLLAINGCSVRIRYQDLACGLDYVESGFVVSVLVPSIGSKDMGILFSPDNGGDPYFPDPGKTVLLEVLN